MDRFLVAGSRHTHPRLPKSKQKAPEADGKAPEEQKSSAESTKPREAKKAPQGFGLCWGKSEYYAKEKSYDNDRQIFHC